VIIVETLVESRSRINRGQRGRWPKRPWGRKNLHNHINISKIKRDRAMITSVHGCFINQCIM